MSDAPERIWALPPNKGKHLTLATARRDMALPDAREYIRAEKAEAALAASQEREARLRAALSEIDALDPEHHIDSCAQSALRGLVLRMGEIARAAVQGETP